MTDSKPWYFSKTIWASLIAVAAAIASGFGVDLDDQVRSDLTDVIMQMITVIASILAVFARLAARSRIE